MTIFDYKVEDNASWRVPNGVDSSVDTDPVTQVSYNDAKAYCTWSNARLPSYKEFWEFAKADKRPVVKNVLAHQPNSKANVIGNVWDMTTTENDKGEIR